MGFDSVSTAKTRDDLFAGTYPVVEEGGTLLTGTDYPRGAVLGLVTASSKYIICDTAAVDGSEDAVAILLDDVDATGGDKVGPLALSGEFQEDFLTLGGATTAADVKVALRALNIYLKPSKNVN